MKERKHYNAQTLWAAVTRLAKRVETFFRVSTPSSRKKLGRLAERVILVVGIWTASGALLWSGSDKPCYNNCGDWVGTPSVTHRSECSNCDDPIWRCWDYHPHKTECTPCGDIYWDCPSNSEGSEHASCSP